MSWQRRHVHVQNIFRQARLTEGMGSWTFFRDMQRAADWNAQNVHQLMYEQVDWTCTETPEEE